MRILAFGGKGGVGKSTISTATAVKLAKIAPDKKVLLISFDIAHNLSDIFSIEVGNDLTKIFDNLYAIEPDPEVYAEEYTREFAQKTRALMKTMPIVGLMPQLNEFIDKTFVSKSIPLALKNAMFFQRILDADSTIDELGEKEDSFNQIKFDYVVCDFPPTGNMVALFEIPQDQVQVVMKSMLQTMGQVKEMMKGIKKLTKFFNPFAWGSSPEEKNLSKEIVEMLYEIERRGERVSEMMRTEGSLRLVTIAEKPSFEEIKRAWEMTKKYIQLDGVHINRITPRKYTDDCEMCRVQRANQDKYLAEIQASFTDVKIWTSHRLLVAPIGIDGLLNLADEVYGPNVTLDEILFPKGNPEQKLEIS